MSSPTDTPPKPPTRAAWLADRNRRLKAEVARLKVGHALPVAFASFLASMLADVQRRYETSMRREGVAASYPPMAATVRRALDLTAAYFENGPTPAGSFTEADFHRAVVDLRSLGLTADQEQRFWLDRLGAAGADPGWAAAVLAFCLGPSTAAPASGLSLTLS